MNEIAHRVVAYLPASAHINATIYVVLTPQSNNFVFEASTKPAISVSLDPAVSPEDFENTVAHESHHIGLSSLSSEIENDYKALTPNERAAADWLGAFGEGIAILAAAGGPEVHPHQHSSAADRARWDSAIVSVSEDMRKVETFLLETARGRLSSSQQGEGGIALFDAQGPWYTIGWLMSATVERALGRPALIACMPDLRLLLIRYNEVAGRQKLPHWSAQLIAESGIK